MAVIKGIIVDIIAVKRNSTVRIPVYRIQPSPAAEHVFFITVRSFGIVPREELLFHGFAVVQRMDSFRIERGERFIIVHQNGRSFSRGEDGRPVFENVDEDLAVIPLVGDGLWMRIKYVFTPVEEGDEADTAIFSWSTDGKTWTTADFKLRMRFTLDYFTGYRSALYNYATLGEGGAADFDYFHQKVF